MGGGKNSAKVAEHGRGRPRLHRFQSGGSWWRGRAFRLGTNFDAGKWFTLLAKDADHVNRCAAAQADEHQFRGAVSRLHLRAIDHNAVTRTGLPHETLFIYPSGACFDHSIYPLYYLRLSVRGSG